eukprot:6190409-Pleurochrysis_carterae.AAC.1
MPARCVSARTEYEHIPDLICHNAPRVLVQTSTACLSHPFAEVFTSVCSRSHVNEHSGTSARVTAAPPLASVQRTWTDGTV